MEEQLENIKKIREIPKEVKKDIDKKVYKNILISTIIMAGCVLLLFGFKNISSVKYITDLRIMSVLAIIASIFLIERAYRKKNLKLGINAIETVIISIIILLLPYMYIYYFYKFPAIVVFISSMLGVYYSVKGIIIIFIERNNYKKSVNDIKDIVK